MYTIEDLRNGKCAVINDGTLDELKVVLKLAFKNDKSDVKGKFKYYFKSEGDGLWIGASTNKPSQSVKDFLKPLQEIPLSITELNM